MTCPLYLDLRAPLRLRASPFDTQTLAQGRPAAARTLFLHVSLTARINPCPDTNRFMKHALDSLRASLRAGGPPFPHYSRGWGSMTCPLYLDLRAPASPARKPIRLADARSGQALRQRGNKFCSAFYGPTSQAIARQARSRPNAQVPSATQARLEDRLSPDTCLSQAQQLGNRSRRR